MQRQHCRWLSCLTKPRQSLQSSAAPPVQPASAAGLVQRTSAPAGRQRCRKPWPAMASAFAQQGDGRPAPEDAFPQLSRIGTPLKRSRAQVTQRISGDLARTSAEAMFDGSEMDNVRSQKRFLSEVSLPGANLPLTNLISHEVSVRSRRNLDWRHQAVALSFGSHSLERECNSGWSEVGMIVRSSPAVLHAVHGGGHEQNDLRRRAVARRRRAGGQRVGRPARQPHGNRSTHQRR